MDTPDGLDPDRARVEEDGENILPGGEGGWTGSTTSHEAMCGCDVAAWRSWRASRVASVRGSAGKDGQHDVHTLAVALDGGRSEPRTRGTDHPPPRTLAVEPSRKMRMQRRRKRTTCEASGSLARPPTQDEGCDVRRTVRMPQLTLQEFLLVVEMKLGTTGTHDGSSRHGGQRTRRQVRSMHACVPPRARSELRPTTSRPFVAGA